MTNTMKEKYNKILENALNFERDEKIRAVIRNCEDEIAKIGFAYYFRDELENENEEEAQELADCSEAETDMAIVKAQHKIIGLISEYENLLSRYKIL